jgi:uncharacterized protein
MKKLRNIVSSVITRLTTMDGNPRKIASGYALGIFLTTTPFLGVKALIALLVTHILKWKKAAAIIGVYHVNGLTAPFFYGFSFLVGKFVLGYDCTFNFPDKLNFQTAIACFAGTKEIFLSLLVGGLIIGIPASYIAYKSLLAVLNKRRIAENSAGNYALVTGASQGLGKEISVELAKNKFNLLLVSLKDEGLKAFAAELKEKYKIDAQYLETDLCDNNSVYQIASWADSYKVNILINNAGVGGTREFESVSPDYIDRIIQINIRATSMLTRLMLPQLKAQEKSYILNVASMASFSPIAFKTVYPASKAFVYSFSRCLHEELRGTNVFVSVIHPGPMKTNADVTCRINKQGFLGKIGLVSTPKMARIAVTQLFSRNSIVIPGFLNKMNWLLMRIVPAWLKLKVLSRVFRNELQHGSVQLG